MTAEQIARAQSEARAWQPASPPPASTVPPAMESLSDRELLAGIQRELNRLGYDTGPVDGLMGNRTCNAIRAYQASVGLADDGQPSAVLLARLRQDVAVAPAPPPDLPSATRIVLDDDFGDFRLDPQWTVISGRFEVDGGGLRTVVEQAREAAPGLGSGRPEEIGLAVLQIILQQAAGGGRPPGDRSP